MSAFAPSNAKKRKADSGNGVASGEYFAEIPKIPFEGPKSTNPLAFQHYNADEVVHGKTMKEWLRFSVCFWHTFRGTGTDPFGFPTQIRHWDDGSDSLEVAKHRLRAAFELFTKLGVEYWTFHDRDIAPVGATIEETNKNLDEIVALAKELQASTGVKLLWGTANLFAHPRYMCGAGSSPSVEAYAFAGAQVKKALEVTKELGGKCFVFWNGRDGYQSILNTKMKRELDHVAAFYRMAIDHCEKIDFKPQFLIEPKPREPVKHQYDYDAQTVIGFLKTYGLDSHFKLNIEPNHTTLAGHDYEHDIVFAAEHGMLGSVDSNTGDPLLGWDTDQFPMDVKKATLVMKAIIEMGGLAPGGLNFDCKVRRESTELADMFIAHIGAMDTFARALKAAARIIEEDRLPGMVRDRYSSWESEIGKKIEAGEATLAELEEFAKAKGEAEVKSGQQELYEVVFNSYV